MRVSIRFLRGFAAIAMSWCVAGAAPADPASPPLPEVKRIPAGPVFPLEELRAKREGTVEVGFSIDAKGIPRHVTVTKSESRAFNSAAKKAIKSARYEITEAWIAEGGPAATYHVSVVFDVAPCAKPPSGSPDNTVMFICGEQHRL